MFYEKQKNQGLYEGMDKFNEKISLNNVILERQKRILCNKIASVQKQDSHLSNIKEGLKYALKIVSVIELSLSIVSKDSLSTLKIVTVLLLLMVVLGAFYIYYCCRKREVVNELFEYKNELYYINETIQKKSKLRVKKIRRITKSKSKM